MKTSLRQPDVIAWSSGEDKGAYVAIRNIKGRKLIVINNGRGNYLVISQSIAAQLASGIDAAIEKIAKAERPTKSGI